MFKVGDRVRCVDSTGTSLRHDYVYRVEEVSDDSRFVRFWEYELDGIGGIYTPNPVTNLKHIKSP